MVEVREWSRDDTARMLRVPGTDDDKYSRGVVALRTGSAAYPGAAVLSVEAAWRAGAGYVKYTGSARDAVLARRPETVASDDLGRTRAGAWVIGSGTDPADRSEDELATLSSILTGETPVVVDAGALDLAADASAPLIVTPHAGEFARLREMLGLGERGADAATGVARTADALGGHVLLKGARTLIAAPGGTVIAVEAGTGWLSTAGTGDVLAGVLGTMIAARSAGSAPLGSAELAEAAAAAVWLHGAAARRAAGVVDGRPGHPIVALDVAEALPGVIGDLLS